MMENKPVIANTYVFTINLSREGFRGCHKDRSKLNSKKLKKNIRTALNCPETRKTKFGIHTKNY